MHKVLFTSLHDSRIWSVLIWVTAERTSRATLSITRIATQKLTIKFDSHSQKIRNFWLFILSDTHTTDK